MDKTAPDGIWFCWLKAPMQDAMSRHVVHGCRQGEQVHWPVACTGHEEAEAEGGCPAMRQRMGLERWLLAAGLVGTRCRNGERDRRQDPSLGSDGLRVGGSPSPDPRQAPPSTRYRYFQKRMGAQTKNSMQPRVPDVVAGRRRRRRKAARGRRSACRGTPSFSCATHLCSAANSARHGSAFFLATSLGLVCMNPTWKALGFTGRGGKESSMAGRHEQGSEESEERENVGVASREVIYPPRCSVRLQGPRTTWTPTPAAEHTLIANPSLRKHPPRLLCLILSSSGRTSLELPETNDWPPHFRPHSALSRPRNIGRCAESGSRVVAMIRRHLRPLLQSIYYWFVC